MAGYRRILVLPDLEAGSQSALERAADLAQRAGSRLDLMACVYDDHLAGSRFGDSEGLAEARRFLVQAARSKLDALAAPLRTAGLQVECHVIFDHPLADAVIATAQQLRPDLIVKDTHYHLPLQRALFSNTDWELIRLCPFNLLLVKRRPWSDRHRVMAAVDPVHVRDKPAALDHEILKQAAYLGKLLEGELHVVHTYPISVPAAAAASGVAAPAAIDVETIRRSLEATHRRALDELVTDLAAHTVHLEAGEPRRQLIESAEALEADVVVAGAVSRSRFKRLFLGYTAQQILDRLPCDLLIVRLPNVT